MKALIFGANGQDGYYLRNLLLREGLTVCGGSRTGGDIRIDVSNAKDVRAVVKSFLPDYVFHLAATSSVDHEFLWENHGAISTGTLAVLDAVSCEVPAAKVLLVGSGLQFVNRGEPLDENAPLDFSSPYVVARNHSLFAARYFRRRGLRVYFAYLFNHDSPLRGSRHLNMKVAESAVRIAHGMEKSLAIGHLDAEKEFTFAGDVVSALWILVRQDAVFECVVGSGITYRVRDWVQFCFQDVGLVAEEWVKGDERFARPFERLQSNPKVLRALGWSPSVSFAELGRMLMAEARKRIVDGAAIVKVAKDF